MTLITGKIIDSAGAPVPGAVLTLASPYKSAKARSGGAQLPKPVGATADAAGQVTIDLLPGRHIGEVSDGGRRWPIEVVVPDAPSAALEDCVEGGGGELAPASVLAAQEARDEAQAAATLLGTHSAQPPGGSALVTWAAAERRGLRTLRQVLGWDYNPAADDAGARISEAVPYLASSGLTLTDPDGITARCTSSIRPAAGMRFELGEGTKILRAIASTGVANPLFGPSDLGAQYADVTLIGGTWEAETAGVMISHWGDRFRLKQARVINSISGASLIYGGYDCLVSDIWCQTNTEMLGNDSCRLFAGSARVEDSFFVSGDDCIAMSPIADATSPRRGHDITGYQVVNCWGFSNAARVLFIGHVDSSGHGSPATGARVQNGLVVGLTGSARDFAMVIQSDTVGPAASIGQIDRIRVAQTRLTVRNPSTPIAQAVLVAEATPGAIRNVDIDGLVLHDIPNPSGLKIYAEHASVRISNSQLEGRKNGLLLGRFGDVHLSGRVACTGSEEGVTAPIRIWATGEGRLFLDGTPTLEGVISNAGGIKIDGGGARVYGSHVVVNKAEGATNTRAATSPATATITMDGALGSVDLATAWGGALLSGGIASGAAGSALTKDVMVITDSDNHGFDVRGISDAVIWRAPTASRSPSWSLNGFAASGGDRVRILHDSASAYTLRVFDLVSGLDLATISRGQWLDAEFDGEAFVLIGTGGTASSGTWMSGEEPLLRDIAASVNTGALANRILRATSVNTAVFKSADGAGGAWLDAFGATRYIPGHRLDGTAAGTWIASSVSGWYYLTPALTDVVQVIEGDRIPLVTGTISASDPAGRWALGNADGLSETTLYVKPFGGNPGTLTSGLLRYRTAAEGVMLTTEARRVTWGTAAPITGYGMLGDVHWSWTPTPSGVPGWRCTATGSPGTWTPMAVLGLTASGATTWGDIQGKPASLAGYGVADHIEAGITTPSGLWGYLTSGRGVMTARAEYAGMMRMRPYVARSAGTITAVSINVATAVAGSFAKVALYASDPTTGQPVALIAETADMSCNAIGPVTAAIGPVPQVAGVQYWVAVRVSTNQSLSTDPSGVRLNGMSTPIIATSVPTCISRIVSYASPAPSTWVWSASELTTNREPWMVVAQYA